MKPPLPRSRLHWPSTTILVLILCAPHLCATDGHPLWSHQHEGILFSSAAVTANRVLYVGTSMESGDPPEFSGALHAIDISDPLPRLLWTFPTDDWIDSSPAIAGDGTIYIGSWNGILYALNPDTGLPIWSFSTDGPIIGSPAIGPDGVIVFGSGDGFFYCLNSEGQLVWETLLISEIESSPAIDEDGSIYVGTLEGVLYSLSVENGEILWSFEVEDTPGFDRRIMGSPAITPDGSIVFGSGNTRLYNLDPDGSERWNTQFLEELDSSPAIDHQGNIYFGSRSGFFYKLDQSGLEIWSVYLGDIYFSSPAIDAAGNVYIPAYSGNGQSELYAFSTEGDLLWSRTIPAVVDASPTLTPDGHLVLGGFDGRLRAFRAGYRLAPDGWPKFRRTLWNSGYRGDDTTVTGLPGLFPRRILLGAGWSYTKWLGLLFGDAFPWIYRPDWGWVYAAGPGVSSHWFYQLTEGWLWTQPQIFPYLYRASTNSWIYLDLQEGQGARYYDFSTQQWAQ